MQDTGDEALCHARAGLRVKWLRQIESRLPRVNIRLAGLRILPYSPDPIAGESLELCSLTLLVTGERTNVSPLDDNDCRSKTSL